MKEDIAMNKEEMDEMVSNFKNGKVSEPVDLSDFLERWEFDMLKNLNDAYSSIFWVYIFLVT